MPLKVELVVEDSFKRCGVGSFAIHFAEEYIKKLGKSSLLIFMTKDKEPAARCYLQNGYKIVAGIQYAVGDGIIRPGYKFQKDIAEP
jgi:GNAT superfamily N-acetyltransferase